MAQRMPITNSNYAVTDGKTEGLRKSWSRSGSSHGLGKRVSERALLQVKCRKTKMRKFKAWLVTWEWIGDHAKRDEKFLAALDSRLSAETVRGYVELLYLIQCPSLSDRVAYARSRNAVPFPAKFMDIKGVPWHVAIHCGDNPFLLARRVDDLTVNTDPDGKQRATWKERSIDMSAKGRNRTEEED